MPGERKTYGFYGPGDSPKRQIAFCLRCYPKGGVQLVNLISPRGTVHHTETGETTDCGFPCTGDRWWHKP